MGHDGSGVPPLEGRLRLPRSARVRQGTEIRQLLRRGRRIRRRHLEVFALPEEGPRSRYGLVVPKHGREIVERNLLRRRLREIGRTELLPLLHGGARPLRVLVRTRPSAYHADFQTLRGELLAMGTQLCSDASWSD